MLRGSSVILMISMNGKASLPTGKMPGGQVFLKKGTGNGWLSSSIILLHVNDHFK
jgi:hypothetical protein